VSPFELLVFTAYVFASCSTFGVLLTERPRSESLSGRALLLFAFLALLWPLVWFVSFLCWWRLK
jgi:hypothetical protein